jgi:hypothetical protein
MFLLGMIAFVAVPLIGVALAQVGVDPALTVEVVEESGTSLLGWLARGIPLLVVICSGLSAAFPSTNKVMGFVDFFAINWLKARNDPGAQAWSK